MKKEKAIVDEIVSNLWFFEEKFTEQRDKIKIFKESLQKSQLKQKEIENILLKLIQSLSNKESVTTADEQIISEFGTEDENLNEKTIEENIKNTKFIDKEIEIAQKRKSSHLIHF